VNLAVETPAPLWLNSGGPMSRTRTERVRESLVGRDDGHVRCPSVYRLALAFDGLDPVDVLHELLGRHGFSSPEGLRAEFPVPAVRLIATPLPPSTPRLDARAAAAPQVLLQALMLGLCTQHLYDPARPVLWTAASLGRALELFDPAGFYA
jgi:hypothetical protein